MKFKKVMLVTFLLLAILTIGAVSASDDAVADDLTASDITEDSIEETPVDEVIAETPEDTTGIAADDFNVWVTNKTLDLDNDTGEVAITFDSPQGADGEFNIWVGGSYKKTIDLSNETLGQSFNVTLNELHISTSGDFPVQIKYFPNNGDNLIFDAGTLTAVKYYSPDQFDTTTFDEVRDVKYRAYSFSRVPTSGTLVMYVNGVEQYRKYINDKNPYLQLYVEDLNITDNGVYNIRSEYIVEESGQVISLDDFNTSVTCMPVNIFLTDMSIDVDASYKASLGSVYDDNCIVGTISAYIGEDQVFTKQYADSDYISSVDIDDYTLPENFALGNHTVKIVYSKGGKEYVKEGNVTFYADPNIENPYSMYEGDKKYITVKYHKGSTGTMVVYNTVGSTADWKKGTIFATANLNGNGSVSIPLSNLTAGYHGFCLNITLGSYSVEKYVDVNVMAKQDSRPSPNLAIDANDIKYGEDETITITANNTFSGVVLVTITGADFSEYVTVTNGVGSVKISNLNATNNYYVDATFTAMDTDAFKSGHAYSYFSVEKVASDFDVDGYEFDLEYGDVLKLNVTNLKGATGVTANVDGGNATVVGNTIIVSDLSTGSHTLVVDTIPDDNHKTYGVEVIINVEATEGKIIMKEYIELVMGNSMNVTVTTVGAKGITAKIDGENATVDGYVIEIPDSLSLGNHTLTVTTIPEDGFESVTKDATIAVKKLPSSVSLSKDELGFIYGYSDSVEVTYENATGFKAEIVDNTGDYVNITGDVIVVSDLTPGDYVLKVTTIVDESHEPATVTANVTVDKDVVSVFIYGDLEFDYGSSATAVISNDTEVIAEIDGQPAGDSVVISDYNVTVSNLAPGIHVLKITPVADPELYYFEPAIVNVTVNKLKAEVSINGDLEFNYTSSATTDISNNTAVIAQIDGQPAGGAVSIENNKVTVSNLDAGKYVLTIIPDVDESIYEITPASVNVTVNKIKTSISIMNDIVCEYGSNASTAVESNVKFTAEVDGYPGAAVVNGNMVTVSGLNVGKYTLVVTTDDKNYETATDTANITVNKAKVDVSVGNIEYVYGTSGSANASPVDAKFTATVIDQPNAKVDVSGNKITVSNLAVGSYTLLVTLDDGNYDVANATANITVKPAATYILADKVTITTYGTAAKVIITLKDANGNPISGKTVTVVIKGVKTVTAQTNKNGQIVVTTPKALEYGQYKLAISFKGDDNYTSSSKTVKVAVFKSVPKLTYSKKVVYKRNKQKKYTIILKSDLGYKIKKAKVYLTVNKKTYSGITNNKGKCIFKLNKLTKKGSYVAYIKYKGDKTHYKGLTQKAIITVK